MTRFGTEYGVSRPTGQCAATGEPLEVGATCVATLCERETDDGFDRLDFAVDAWEGGARPERLFSFWRMVVPDREERKKLLVDDAVLSDLFERLADDERPQRVAFRFVLGLILMRKRLLKFNGRRSDGDQDVWLMVPRGADPENPPIEMVDPRLSEDDVRELTAQLGEVLQGDF